MCEAVGIFAREPFHALGCGKLTIPVSCIQWHSVRSMICNWRRRHVFCSPFETLFDDHITGSTPVYVEIDGRFLAIVKATHWFSLQDDQVTNFTCDGCTHMSNFVWGLRVSCAPPECRVTIMPPKFSNRPCVVSTGETKGTERGSENQLRRRQSCNN